MRSVVVDNYNNIATNGNSDVLINVLIKALDSVCACARMRVYVVFQWITFIMQLLLVTDMCYYSLIC